MLGCPSNTRSSRDDAPQAAAEQADGQHVVPLPLPRGDPPLHKSEASR